MVQQGRSDGDWRREKEERSRVVEKPDEGRKETVTKPGGGSAQRRDIEGKQAAVIKQVTNMEQEKEMHGIAAMVTKQHENTQSPLSKWGSGKARSYKIQRDGKRATTLASVNTIGVKRSTPMEIDDPRGIKRVKEHIPGMREEGDNQKGVKGNFEAVEESATKSMAGLSEQSCKTQ